MVGTAAAAFRTQLGPLLNGVVVGESWEPAKTMDFPGIWDFLKQYQPKAAAEGVDPLGYFLPPFAYAEMQVLEEAITKTGGLDETKLADYIHSHPFKTIVGEINFGPDGEWTKAAESVRPVSRHQVERHRAVPRRLAHHHSLPAAIQDRRADHPVHQGSGVAPSLRARCAARNDASRHFIRAK